MGDLADIEVSLESGEVVKKVLGGKGWVGR